MTILQKTIKGLIATYILIYVAISLQVFAQNYYDPSYTKLESLTTIKEPETVTTGFSFVRKSLTEFPPDLFKFVNISTLSLTDNKIAVIPPEINKLKKLKSLQLINTQITDITPLRDLKTLEVLWISKNRIKSIVPIQELPLKSLDISENPIENLETEIAHFSSLEVLYMNSLNLKRIPESVCKFRHLQKLTVIKNSINVLNLCFRANNFRELIATDSGIRKLEINTKYIDYLDVSSNELTELPENMDSLSNLRTLKARGNKIKRIKILSKSLVFLDLGYNQIESLPDLCDFKKITILQLDGNSLRSLNIKGANCLPVLQRLEINNNPDLIIDKELLALPGLEELIVDEDTLIRSGIPKDSETYRKFKHKIY